MADTFVVDLKSGQSERVMIDDQLRLRLVKGEDGYVGSGEFVSTIMDLGKAATKRIDWTPQWTTPQTWDKYEKNPIFGPKQSGSWDTWTNGVSIVRNPDGLTYKMFYASRYGGIGFAEATIADPLTWKEHPASPVLTPAKNWEGKTINQPRVVKVTDTHWRMYYTGWGYRHRNRGSAWAFNLAESFDAGVSWERYSEGPMLNRGAPGAPDDGGVSVPEVRKIGDRWMMWYTAMKNIAGRQAIHLCLATSDDGIHWTKYPGNPVLTDDFTDEPTRNVISRCFVRHEAGVFHMWYSHAKPRYRVKYAESLDGVHWEPSPIEPVLDAGPSSWDGATVEYPEVDLADGQWRLWFCGNGFGKVGFATGRVETTIEIQYRTGVAAQPDEQWTSWRAVERGAQVDMQPHVQIRAILRSTNLQLSPMVSRIKISRKE